MTSQAAGLLYTLCFKPIIRYIFWLIKRLFPLNLRATDDVFQMLEDNQVTLSTMKASRYVKAFEQEVSDFSAVSVLVDKIM